MSAADFQALVADFQHNGSHRREEERQAADRRKALVSCVLRDVNYMITMAGVPAVVAG